MTFNKPAHLGIMLLLLIIPKLMHAETQPLEELTIEKARVMMKAGSLTSAQLAKHYIEKIKRLDDGYHGLNSVVQLNPHWLSEALQLDAELREGRTRGPLHGIPILVKDNIDAINMNNTAGSLALRKHQPQDDAFIIAQLKRQGALILGKTNLSEWANFRSMRSASGWSSLWGQTRNPYDKTRSPCGSSSGSAVAVAADLAMLSIGTETDGSIICPASINGIVGIKPSLGALSRDGIIPIAISQDTAGPMARNVKDAVLMLDAMALPDPKDPNVMRYNSKLIEHLKLDGLHGKRIGIVRTLTGYHEGVDHLFEKSLKVLEAQGAVLVDGLEAKDRGLIGDAEFDVLLYEFKAGLNDYLKQSGSDQTLASLITFNRDNEFEVMPFFKQEIFEMAESTEGLHAEKYLQAKQTAKQLAGMDNIDRLLRDHQLDLLIAPSNQPAWKIDVINGDNFLGSASQLAAVAGYPHITVPMGYYKGLPIGLSFFSGYLAEPTVIEAAYAFEQATKARKPPQLQ